MKGDFSRVLSFQTHGDPPRRGSSLSRIRLQQGRPLIDADINEQFDILQGQLENLIDGVMADYRHGYFGQCEQDAHFALQPPSTAGSHDFELMPGTYYAGGMRCRLSERIAIPSLRDGEYYLALLKARQRELTLAESREHEPALNGLPAVHAKVEFDVEWVPVEEWATDRQYQPNDFIRHTDGGLYQATLPHTSGTDTSPGASEAPWRDLPLCLVFPNRAPPVIASFSLRRNEYTANALYRVEFQRVSRSNEENANPILTLKIAKDNAAHSFEVESGATRTIRLVANALNASYLPKVNEWLEVESVGGDPSTATLLKIESSSGDGVYELNKSAENATQVRVWQAVRELVPDSGGTVWNWELDEGPIRSVKIDAEQFGRELPEIATVNQYSGYHWIIPIRPLEDVQATQDDTVDIVGTPRLWRTAQVPIALTRHGQDRPSVVKDCRVLYRMTGVAADCGPAVQRPAGNQDPLQPEQDEDAAISRDAFRQLAAARSVISAETLDATPCRRLFAGTTTDAANRWLASAEFGEIRKLSVADLRGRLRRDCEAEALDDRQLDQDVAAIVRQRNALLQGRRVSDTSHLS